MEEGKVIYEADGYRVVVYEGRWDEDAVFGGWDAFKDGAIVDGGRASATYETAYGYGFRDPVALVTRDCYEFAEAFVAGL